MANKEMNYASTLMADLMMEMVENDNEGWSLQIYY